MSHPLRVVFLATLCLSAASALSQLENWSVSLPGLVGGNFPGGKIIVDSTGNTHVLISTYNPEDYRVVKYDNEGEKVWTATYNSPFNLGDFAQDFAVDATGNVYVTGASLSTATTREITTVKFNSSGEFKWEARGTSNSEAHFIKLTSTGVPVVCGRLLFPGTLGIGVWRYDPGDGTPSGAYSNSINTVPNSLQVDDAGAAYICFGDRAWKVNAAGSRLWERFLSPYQASAAFWTVDKVAGKLHAAYGIAWDDVTSFAREEIGVSTSPIYDYPYLYNDRPQVIILATNGDYILGGVTRFGDGDDFLLMRVSTSNNQRLWSRRISGRLGGQDRVRHIAEGGGFIYLSGEISEAGGVSFPVLYKVNGMTGAVVWSVERGVEATAGSVWLTPDGDLVTVAGRGGAEVIRYHQATFSMDLSSIYGGGTSTITVTLNSPVKTYKPISILDEISGSSVGSGAILDAGTTTTITLSTDPRSSDLKQQLRPSFATFVPAPRTIMAPRPLNLSTNPSVATGGTNVAATLAMTSLSPTEGIPVQISDNSSALVTPAWVNVGPLQEHEDFLVGVLPVSAQVMRSIYATAYGTTRSAQITINPPSLLSFTLTPFDTDAGTTLNATVTLNGPAALGGRVVTITDETSLINSPGTITVPAGQASKSFTITTNPAPSNTSYTRPVFAKLGEVTKTVYVKLRGMLVLTNLTISPPSIQGGNPATGTVTMSQSGGYARISLSSNSSAVSVPDSIEVISTASTNFGITTQDVSATYVRQVTASYRTITKTASITLTP